MSEVKIINTNEQTLRCSDCNSALMHYKIHADAPVTHTIQATCPFCKDGESFQVKINGLFQYGPIGQDESLDPTIVENIETNGELSKFIIRKRVK